MAELVSDTSPPTSGSQPPMADFTKDAPDNLPSPPFIHVEGIPNFRDLGGYSCSLPSRRVRPGLLFRCAQLSQCTTAGAKTMNTTLSIRNIYDLRSMPEIRVLQEKGYPIEIDGINRTFTPVYEEEDYSPDVLATKLKWYTAEDEDLTAQYSRGFVDAYRHIAQSAGPAYCTILSHVLERPTEPLLFHCTAGKDRTGVLAGLILKLCGVDDETIAWEYSITEPGLGSWRETIVQRMMRRGMGSGTQGTGMSRVQAERICGSRAGNMLVFLREVVDGEFGGVEAYLRKFCGFTGEEVERIRQNLVEVGEPVVRPVDVRPFKEQRNGEVMG